MRIVCIGGGPAGLYFALLMKKHESRHHAVARHRAKPALRHLRLGRRVLRRRRWQTMRGCDPETRRRDRRARSTIGTTSKSVSRAGACARPATASSASAASGCSTSCRRAARRSASSWSSSARSESDLRVSRRRSHRRLPTASTRRSATDTRMSSSPISSCGRTATSGSARNKLFDAFTFDFRKTEHGWFQAHIYRFDADTSTFIVETTEETFNAHGLDAIDQDAVRSPSARSCSPRRSAGARLKTNARHLRGSAWLNFSRLICEHWRISTAAVMSC